jgi:hypothetical protein
MYDMSVVLIFEDAGYADARSEGDECVSVFVYSCVRSSSIAAV